MSTDKTTVKMNCDDSIYKEWSEGEEGYIDGYTLGGDGRPYVVVVINTRLILCDYHCVDVTYRPSSRK